MPRPNFEGASLKNKNQMTNALQINVTVNKCKVGKILFISKNMEVHPFEQIWYMYCNSKINYFWIN